MRTYTEDEVADILLEVLGDDCICDFNGIDEWLPFVCQYRDTECPCPKEKNGCLKEWLRRRKEKHE